MSHEPGFARAGQKRTINGVDNESLAQGFLVFRGGVAAVVANLVATNVANGLDLVWLNRGHGE